MSIRRLGREDDDDDDDDDDGGGGGGAARTRERTRAGETRGGVRPTRAVVCALWATAVDARRRKLDFRHVTHQKRVPCRCRAADQTGASVSSRPRGRRAPRRLR
jgi:hypothetical protein